MQNVIWILGLCRLRAHFNQPPTASSRWTSICYLCDCEQDYFSDLWLSSGEKQEEKIRQHIRLACVTSVCVKVIQCVKVTRSVICWLLLPTLSISIHKAGLGRTKCTWLYKDQLDLWQIWSWLQQGFHMPSVAVWGYINLSSATYSNVAFWHKA